MSRRWPEQTAVVGDDGWSCIYACHSLELARGIKITVNLSIDPKYRGYKVSFLDRSLKDHIENLEDAKAAGLRLARKVLNEALKGLEEKGSGKRCQ